MLIVLQPPQFMPSAMLVHESASRCGTKAGHAITSTPGFIRFQPAKIKTKTMKRRIEATAVYLATLTNVNYFIIDAALEV